jgi:LPS sulfotransferase NodH
MNAAEVAGVRFIILAHARSGSNLLGIALAQHPRVAAFGEPFNGDIYSERPTNYFHGGAYHRGEDGAEFLDNLYRDNDGQGNAVGFKILYDQASALSRAQTAWQFLIEHTEIRVIRLQRANLLAAFVSLKTAIQTGEWARVVSDPATNETLTFRLDPTECLDYFRMIERYTRHARTLFRDHRVLDFVYEYDLSERFEVSLRRTQEFLGVSDFPVPPLTYKQSDSELSERIENFAALAEYFAESPYANYFR